MRGWDRPWEEAEKTHLRVGEDPGQDAEPGTELSTLSPTHRLQLVLKILILCPDDADGNQARPGGAWGGLWKGRAASVHRTPHPQPQSPLTPCSVHSPPLGLRLPSPWALQGWGKRRGCG